MASAQPRKDAALLLLPSPTSVAFSDVAAQFRATLTEAITKSDTNMDVTVLVEDELGDFSQLEELFRSLYTLACMILGENDEKTVSFYVLSQTPSRFLALSDWVNKKTAWSSVYVPESHDALLTHAAVREGLITPIRSCGNVDTAISPERRPPILYRTVAVGGTFDHLHLGHKLLLTMTVMALDVRAAASKSINVGISGSTLLQKKQYVDELESWPARQQAVHSFVMDVLSCMRPGVRQIHVHDSPGSVQVECSENVLLRYIELHDPSGPTISNPHIDALVISEETRSGGDAINTRRREKGWKELDILQVGVIDAALGPDATGSTVKLSSTAIRKALHERHERV